MASSSSSSEAMSAPPTSTLPDVGLASPPSRWSSVDFPDPDGPDGDELAMVGHEVDAHCVDGRLVIDVALAEPPGFDGDLLALGRPDSGRASFVGAKTYASLSAPSATTTTTTRRAKMCSAGRSNEWACRSGGAIA